MIGCSGNWQSVVVVPWDVAMLLVYLCSPLCTSSSSCPTIYFFGLLWFNWFNGLCWFLGRRRVVNGPFNAKLYRRKDTATKRTDVYTGQKRRYKSINELRRPVPRTEPNSIGNDARPNNKESQRMEVIIYSLLYAIWSKFGGLVVQ